MRQIWPRFVWSRVPEGFAGVVRRGRKVEVRSAGARVGLPLATLTLMSTTTMRRQLGPLWIAMPDGSGLSAMGTVSYHVSDPAAFSGTVWSRLPRVLEGLIGVGIREAVQKASVDPRTHPEVVDEEARRLLGAHLEPAGLTIDSVEVGFVAGTSADLATAQQAATHRRRSPRWKGAYLNGVMLALALFFLGLGTWNIVDSLWIRPAEYAHLERVGIAGVITVTDYSGSSCEGDYTVGGRRYHETIPDIGHQPLGSTMPILIDPDNPTTFFPEDYVRNGRNAGFGVVTVFGIGCLGVALWIGALTFRLERKLRRLVTA